MKKLLLSLLATLSLTTAFAVAPLSSPQVGYTPSNGYILKTNGATSTWVATSSLGLPGGTVTSVSGSGSVLSSGGNTPTIQLANLTNQLVLFGQGSNIFGTSTGFSWNNGLNIGSTNTSGSVLNLHNTGTGSNYSTSTISIYSGLPSNADYLTGAITTVMGGTSVGDGRMTFSTEGVDTMTVKYSKVGIGTTTPQGTLVVQGSDSILPFFVASSTGATRFIVNISDNVGIGTSTQDDSLTIQGTRSAQHLFETYNYLGVSKFIIDSTGAVGIGGITPTQTLHVSGGMRLTGQFNDSTNASGTVGQVLQSTGTSTLWSTISGFVTNAYASSTFATVNNPTFTGIVNLPLASSTAISTGNLYATGTVSLATTTVNGNLTITGSFVPRVTGYASNASTTFDLSTIGDGGVATTTISATSTLVNPTGVYMNGMMFETWLRATTTAYLLTWGTTFASSTNFALPTRTASGTTKVLFEYRLDSGKLECANVDYYAN